MHLNFSNWAVLVFIFGACLRLSTQQVSTNPDDIGFYLYPNSLEPQDSDRLYLNDLARLTNSRYDASKNLIVLIHGFAQNHSSVFPTVLTQAYLTSGYGFDHNILTVDWGTLSTPNPAAALPFPVPVSSGLAIPLAILSLLEYPLAASNVQIVGHRVAEFIAFLTANEYLTSLDKVHIIGMSMGAHVGGLVAANLKNWKLGVVGRVTGLDPAGPLFQTLPPSKRLNPRSAAYVDVVHTNAGVFGFFGSLGKADYYVNGGGPTQPGCPVFTTNVSELFCAHKYAISAYASSIYNPDMKGCRSFLGLRGSRRTCTAFGAGSPSFARGDYSIFLK